MIVLFKRGAVVLWQQLLLWDRSLLLWVRRWEQRWLTRWMKTMTQLGDPATWIMMGLMLVALGEPVQRIMGLFAISSLSSVLCVQIVKNSIRRHRPRASIKDFNALVQEPDRYSFPSGHTTTAVAIAIALLPENPMLGAMALFHAANIAASRVYLGAHYPLDVAAGALLGTGVGLLTRLLIG